MKKYIVVKCYEHISPSVVEQFDDFEHARQFAELCTLANGYKHAVYSAC